MPSICAYRFQLRCRPSGERVLRRFAGIARQVWNRALAEQRARYVRGEKYASYADMCRWLTNQRSAPATAWLADAPVHTQQQALKRLDETYKRFFDKRGGFPKFKKFGEEPGLRFPDPKQFELDQVNARIKLPKLGWLRLRLSQPVVGELRNATVRREGAKWFASIQVGTDATVEALGVPPTLGIDVGLTAFAALSDGEKIEPLGALNKQQRRLKHAQRAVSRKVKGSANRKKAIVRLGNIHRRIAHQRSDWLHKLTTDLANRHAVITIEDLQVKNMSASARGTAAQPGSNVRQKAGLNRGILDAAWGEFARQLTYKLEWRGGRVILVNPAYTSRTCRICGHESAENRTTQAVFSCVACGHTENADVHAAKNILAAGYAVWEAVRASTSSTDACGGVVRREAPARAKRAAPLKQEPTEATVLA
jgi:putative transposase